MRSGRSRTRCASSRSRSAPAGRMPCWCRRTRAPRCRPCSSRRSYARPWPRIERAGREPGGVNGRLIRQLSDVRLAAEPGGDLQLAPRYAYNLSGHEGRDRRAWLRRAAARRRLRRGGVRGRGRRRRPQARRAPAPQRVRHRGRARRSGSAAIAERFTATDEYRALAACDADRDLRPDSARQPPRAGPRPTWSTPRPSSRGSSTRAGSWCSSRPPTRARPASACSRSSRSPGLAAGREFNLAYSPERIDPGRTDHTIRTTPKVVGGLTDECRRRAAELYRLICDEVVEVSSPEVAELTKLLENIFRSVNIALVNELAQLCDRMGHRRLGGRRRGRHEAVRVHALRPRPRHGRPLPAGRPLLPRVQGPRARLLHRVRRAGREAQPGPAALLRGEDRADAERRRRSRCGARVSCCSASPTRAASATCARRRP